MTSPLSLPTDQAASGRTLGQEEIDLLTEVITSGTLTATKGAQTPALEAELAETFGVAHAVALSSGTAAVHAAVAAVDPEPGDEIVTTSITDMGAITPILYQSAVPVFADVDPRTGNVTADAIAACLSERTRAIVVTHLFGNPCDLGPILALAEARGIPVIEDCAQAYLARSGDALVGTLGAVGCFSLQQGKHITTGEGGFVLTDDDALARRMRVFVNKAWPYGEASPDHEFVALNYRTTELASAVARAQLAKLPAGVERRIAAAERLTKQLAGLDAVVPTPVAPDDTAVYWRYPLHVDADRLPGGPDALAAALREVEVPSAPRYIQKPAFRCRVLAEQRTFGDSRFPFTHARPEAVDYADERFPGTLSYLSSVLVLPWNERFTDEHVDHLASALAHAVAERTREAR
ncbi:MAG: DegT/DnrJ/EryC1/StrS family aminotransferase [Acidimicrobiales bacterium]|nr:DegT/DnrJ/EryC1/StrS family aminotransferase [Acidimicrobiales bacterium]MCB1016390.1 DegT/DnrJ/EryC1/StrS family aminotransferase [Acidimicrobiales bacterium]